LIDITLAGLFWCVDEHRGELNILAGGDPAAVERVRPLLEVLGGRIWNVGDQAPTANAAEIACT
jgi:3-hydroxyisobutyrate dehydrogenase-like beta-hydroxyacid dehydrogenase